MVFDYMDHDMTGLMERLGFKFTVPQVCNLMMVPPRGSNHLCREL